MLRCLLLSLSFSALVAAAENVAAAEKVAAAVNVAAAENAAEPASWATIRANINLGHGKRSDSKTCQLSSGEKCPLSSMPVGGSTLVYADAAASQTQCIYGDPFGFQVIRGASDKLVFYFQGGGACWDKASAEAGLCTTTSEPSGATGIFDPANAANPFKDYTIVHALYCSGDVWGGNATQPYFAHKSKVVTVGINNALSVIDWVEQQFASKALASRLSKFVIMGCSAGSLGTQLWANTLLKKFPSYDSAAVIPDSYAAVFPEGTMGPLMKSFGLCTNTVGLLPPALIEACEAGVLTMPDLEASNIKTTPATVPVAFIQSKIDAVQQSFYDAIGLSMRADQKLITPTDFYDGVNDIFGRYNKHPSFVTYLVDGGQHCFTPHDVMYKTTPTGPRTGDRPTGDGPELATWLAGFPPVPKSGAGIETECEGTVEAPSTVGRDGKNTYCSSTVTPKKFVAA